MSQLVVLNLGSGNLNDGFPGIIAEIWDIDNEPPIKLVGQLPSCPTLLESYSHWRSLYQSLQSFMDWRKNDIGFRIVLESDETPNNISISEFQELNQQLRQQLNIWLDSKGFRQLERRLRARLNSQAYIHVVIQTDDKVLRRLPWHLWNLFADCPNAEVGLSLPEYERPTVRRTAIGKVKILAVLGDSEGIDVEKDSEVLQQLPNADVSIISKPTLQELTEYLWQEEGWDIFFFAGHSNTNFDEEKGYFSLSPSNSITIKQLVNSLRKAISQGLQLAIFNSCDGLGLAKELAQLNIPQAIVMREPIPDLIAQVFVKNFLQTFAAGSPFYKSVREAKERLEGFEEVFPCASWLPVICQNPIHPPPTWLDLVRSMEPQRLTTAKSDGDSADNLVTLVFTDLAQSTLLKSLLSGTDITEKNQVYYETILLPHRRYVKHSIVDYGGRVVETEGDGHFLVFGSAVKAAQWAIQLQEHYHLHPIQTPLGHLEVRIGMHTGQPIKDGRGYSGQEVDFAARIGSLADNSQILLSQMTAVLLHDSKTKGLDCYEHSPTFLKGIGSEVITELLYLERSPHSPRSPRKSQLEITAIISSVTASLIVIAIRMIGLLQPSELAAFDQLMGLRPLEKQDDRLVIVEVTAEDVQRQDKDELKGRSLEDSSLEKLLRNLNAHEPSVIALDIYREVSIEPQYDYLINQFQNNDKFINICRGGTGPNNLGNSPPTEVPPENLEARVGYSNILMEPSDGLLRRNLLSSTFNNSPLCPVRYSLSLLVASHYLADLDLDLRFSDEENDKVLESGSRHFPPLTQNSGGYQKLDTNGYQVLLNYRATKTLEDITPHYLTLTDVLENQFDGNIVRGKIILIGTTDPSFDDLHRTPFSKGFIKSEGTFGVVVQAHMVSQIISAVRDQRRFIWWLPEYMELLWIFAWGGVGSLLAWKFPSWRTFGLAFTGSATLLVFICYGTLLVGGWIPLIPPLFALVFAAGTLVIYRYRFVRNF